MGMDPRSVTIAFPRRRVGTAIARIRGLGVREASWTQRPDRDMGTRLGARGFRWGWDRTDHGTPLRWIEQTGAAATGAVLATPS
jgi:hypothetical protein